MDGQMKCRLVVKQGTQPPQDYELSQAEVTIGRDPACEISISQTSVSRRHARLSRKGDRYYVEDLGSSNGTTLNGKFVQGATPLNTGDQIGLGAEVTLVFEDPAQKSVPTSLSQASIEEIQQTILEQDHSTAAGPPPPELVVVVSGSAPQTYRLTQDQISIGRLDDNDIVIPSKIVSRHHARLERSGDSYQIVLHPDATNRLLFQGKPVTERHRLRDGDEISVESSVPDLSVKLYYRQSVVSTAPNVAPRPVEMKAQPSDKTMLDAEFNLDELSTPPELVITVAGALPQTYTLIREKLTLGRAEDNDIVIPSRIVSRHHARLERIAGGYQMVVLPDAINTLVVKGRPVTDRHELHDGDILRIDSSAPGMMVSLNYQSPSEAKARRESQTIAFGEKNILTIGRDEGNDIKLDFPTISRFHAHVERVGRRYRVRDLHSANGTFVNDERIRTDTWLEPKDTIRIGPYRFEVGEDQFVQYDESSGLRLEAVGLNKWVRKNLNILQDISVVFEPREFIVVVGQSGGGKSTLVDAIAGYRPATDGRVIVNGVDVYKNFDAIRNEIGFVPQRDIIHMELTVYQALDYATRLRMPRDTTKAERHARIIETLEELDLLNRKDVQISRLSGGQQKRVSIGVELLTRPGLFFLDEPTSGLDPGTETMFMHLMRRMADQGRTIVMVTHATKNVMLADKVVFLARGGYLAWFGPPNEALEYFDQYRTERERLSQDMEFDQIYAILDNPEKGSAQDWAKRFLEHPAYQAYVTTPLQQRQGSLPLAAASQAAKKPARRRSTRVSSLRQFSVLSNRNIKVLTRDRSSLILMLAAAPLIGMLDFVIAPLMGKDVFSFVSGDAANASTTLFLLTIYALLVGGLSQMREIVKEADIYKRERLVNLRIFPYVSSKIWVAALLAFYHAAAYTIIHYLAFKMPGGFTDFILIYFTLVLAVMTGMIGGILASALAPNSGAAPLILILLIVPLIVLSGALAPVPSNISAVASTRWAFEGLIGITGMGSDVKADPCWAFPEEVREEMTLEQAAAANCRCMGVAVFDPLSCNFPGIGQYYVPEISQPPPTEPAPLADKPPEPEVPPRPEAPADTTDQIQVAQFLNTLQTYMDDVEQIQTGYKNEMTKYEAVANVYQEEMIAYQKEKARYDIARNSAVQAAQGMIQSMNKEFGWAWVNKHDKDIYRTWLSRAWIAQGIIMLVYFILILLLIKRKDVK